MISLRTAVVLLIHEESLLMGAFIREMNAMVFIYRGKGQFGRSRKYAESGNALFLDQAGPTTLIATASTNLKFLLLAGVPLNEPVARYAPH